MFYFDKTKKVILIVLISQVSDSNNVSIQMLHQVPYRYFYPTQRKQVFT